MSGFPDDLNGNKVIFFLRAEDVDSFAIDNFCLWRRIEKRNHGDFSV
jgi:hypothetical protein